MRSGSGKAHAGYAPAAGGFDPGEQCVTVHILQSGEKYRCRKDETLLKGMARLGRKGIPVGCLNGGCGICKIAIRKGGWRKSGDMSREHVSEREEGQGVVLACRVVPQEDIELEVIGRMQRSVLGARTRNASVRSSSEQGPR